MHYAARTHSEGIGCARWSATSFSRRACLSRFRGAQIIEFCDHACGAAFRSVLSVNRNSKNFALGPTHLC